MHSLLLYVLLINEEHDVWCEFWADRTLTSRLINPMLAWKWPYAQCDVDKWGPLSLPACPCLTLPVHVLPLLPGEPACLLSQFSRLPDPVSACVENKVVFYLPLCSTQILSTNPDILAYMFCLQLVMVMNILTRFSWQPKKSPTTFTDLHGKRKNE